MHWAVRGLRTTVAAVVVAVLMQGTGSIVLGPLADADAGNVVATTAVNIRSTPDTKHPRLGLLRAGDSIKAVGTRNGWTKVEYRGRTAYIKSDYLRSASSSSSPNSTQTSGSTATVRTTANLNLRTGPSLGHSIYHVAPKGTKLQLTGVVSGSYSQLRYRNRTLWAANRYLSTTSAADTKKLPEVVGSARARVALMLRNNDTRNFFSYGDIPKGTVVELTGKVSNGVAQIIWQGNIRWVNNRYLDKIDSSTSSPTAKKPPATKKRYATANLNVWKSSQGSAHEGEIPRTSELAVTGKVEHGRVQIVHKGVLRWVTARYTAATPPPDKLPETTGKKYATATLNLWNAATGTKHTGEIRPGTAVRLVGETSHGRTKILRYGQVWWVTSKYLADRRINASSSGSGRGSVDLNHGYSSGLHKTNSNVQKIVRYVWDNVPEIKTMYGWRRATTPDHPAGRAVDIMIPSWRSNSEFGWELAKYFRSNAKRLNIKYIIYRQKIWNIERDDEGWRRMRDRGNHTANHYDHIHITTYDD